MPKRIKFTAEQQRQMVALSQAGKTNAQIAAELEVSEATVARRLKKLIGSRRARKTGEAVAQAVAKLPGAALPPATIVSLNGSPEDDCSDVVDAEPFDFVSFGALMAQAAAEAKEAGNGALFANLSRLRLAAHTQAARLAAREQDEEGYVKVRATHMREAAAGALAKIADYRARWQAGELKAGDVEPRAPGPPCPTCGRLTYSEAS